MRQSYKETNKKHYNYWELQDIIYCLNQAVITSTHSSEPPSGSFVIQMWKRFWVRGGLLSSLIPPKQGYYITHSLLSLHSTSSSGTTSSTCHHILVSRYKLIGKIQILTFDIFKYISLSSPGPPLTLMGSTHTPVLVRSRHYLTLIIKGYIDWVIEIPLKIKFVFCVLKICLLTRRLTFIREWFNPATGGCTFSKQPKQGAAHHPMLCFTVEMCSEMCFRKYHPLIFIRKER